MKWTVGFCALKKAEDMTPGADAPAWRVGVNDTWFRIKFGRRADAEAAAVWLNQNIPLPDNCDVNQVRAIALERFGDTMEELRRRIVSESCAW